MHRIVIPFFTAQRTASPQYAPFIALAAKGAECTLSEKPENIASGIFLDYGNIAIDCSFESVIEEKSDIYKEKISEIIF